jgi:hypothetical protein
MDPEHHSARKWMTLKHLPVHLNPGEKFSNRERFANDASEWLNSRKGDTELVPKLSALQHLGEET